MTKIIAWLDRLHWLWLLLAAPLLLFPTPRHTPVLFVVPALWLLRWFLTRHTPASQHPHTPAPLPITPLNSALLLITIMVLVSEWATYDLAFSLPKISGMVLGLGAFFAVAREGTYPQGWWLALALYLGTGVGIGALGLLGTAWFTSKISILNPVTSRLPALITGLQGAETGFHPNEIAGALAWVLPVLITLSVFLFLPQSTQRARRKKEEISADSALSAVKLSPTQIWIFRLLLWPAAIFVLAVFILTQSRGGYIGMAVACFLMLFIALPARWRWALLGGILLTGLILALTLSPEDLANLREWVVGEGLTTERALSLNTLESRMEIWSRAIYGLQDFPFTGMGMNTFREVVHVLYPLFLIAPDRDFGHAHNEFLQAGLDLGIPGLIAFIALYVGAFWMLARVWSADHRSSVLSRPMALGLGGGLLAHLLYGMTDAVALGAKPGFLFWMLLGLIAGLYGQVFQHSLFDQQPNYD